MKGKHYCIGARTSDFCIKGKNVTLLKFDEPEGIVKQFFRNNIFLSYDIDVFHPKVTQAHQWSGVFYGGFDGRMFPEQVKDLSLRVIAKRNLTGINVAEYIPFYEREDYKTAKIIVDLLKPMI